MIGKTYSPFRITDNQCQRAVGEFDRLAVTNDYSWTEISPETQRTGSSGIRWNRNRRICSMVLATAIASGLALSALPSEGWSQVRSSTKAPIKSTEVGLASWYGYPYHGRKAANGKTYNMHMLTAAHPTLPLGTRVRVQNLKNAKTVDLEINDRGPFVDGRVIDVSLAAARILGFQRAGLTMVRIDVLSSLAANDAPR